MYFSSHTFFEKMKKEVASQKAVRSSILGHVLLGFHPASLEERFQQEQVKGAKVTDLLANAIWAVTNSIFGLESAPLPKPP